MGHQGPTSCSPSSSLTTAQKKGKGLKGQGGRWKGGYPHPATVRGSKSREPCSKVSSEAHTGLENPETLGKRVGNPGGPGQGGGGNVRFLIYFFLP